MTLIFWQKESHTTWPNERITITSPEEMTSTHSGHFRNKHGHLDVNQKDSTLPLVAAAQALPVTEKKTGTSMECFKKSSWSWEKLNDLNGKSLGRKDSWTPWNPWTFPQTLGITTLLGSQQVTWPSKTPGSLEVIPGLFFWEKYNESSIGFILILPKYDW